MDEFEALSQDQDKEPSEVVSAPRLKEGPISFKGTVDRVIPAGDARGDHMVRRRVVQFHVRDDLHLETGPVDTAALPAVERLPAQCTLVENVIPTPWTRNCLRPGAAAGCSAWTDGSPTDWSPTDTKEWSPSGEVRIAAGK